MLHIMNLHPKGVLEIWGRQLWVIRWHKWEFKFSPEDLCDNFHLTWNNKMCVSSNYRREYLFFTYIFSPVFFIHENLRTSTVCGGGGEKERGRESVVFSVQHHLYWDTCSLWNKTHIPKMLKMTCCLAYMYPFKSHPCRSKSSEVCGLSI